MSLISPSFRRTPWCLPFAVALVGCANRGNPRPPSLHLPALAADLKAERVADHVVLTWTTSDKTSDGLILRTPITAVLCREPAAHRSSAPTPCIAVSRFPVTPGVSRTSDALPPALLSEPPTLLAYRVELLNPKNRSAGTSAPAFAPSGAAPADPGALRVTATRRGAMIEWKQTAEPSAAMELTRTLTDSVKAAPKDAKTSGGVTAGAGATRTVRGPAAAKSKDPNAPVLLRAATATTADPGGLLDPGVVADQTYTYTAQRVRTVQLAGNAYRIRSAASPQASFSYRDIFPPPAPDGLESIASSPMTGPASIDLSWNATNASVEDGLLGYNVYRADLPGGEFKRLNQMPLQSPSFRDLQAQSGHAYRYRVTAVDRPGNESAPSAEVQDSLPTQP